MYCNSNKGKTLEAPSAVTYAFVFPLMNEKDEFVPRRVFGGRGEKPMGTLKQPAAAETMDV